MKKVLITGANGMLATDFVRFCSDRFTIVALDRNHLDISNGEMIEQVIRDIKPDVVLNCAAYTAVDLAETTGKLLNFEVNTLGSYNLAKVTASYGIDYITISTDYVFDGESEDGYDEVALCSPINTYGMAKYLSERLTKDIHSNSITVRTSWLYGGGAGFKNFVNTMLQLGDSGKEIKVVNDQFGCPTYTKDLSLGLAQIIESIEGYRGQIFHLAGNTTKNGITWYDFAKKIFEFSNSTVNLLPCSSGEYPTLAKRPKQSTLINTSDVSMQNWELGLGTYLQSLQK